MMSGVSTDKKHIDGPLTVSIFCHYWIDRWEEYQGSASFAAPEIQNRREISKHCVIGGQIHLPRWHRAPANCFSDTSGQLANESTRVTHGIEVIEHFGSMVLDLREQNIFKRCLGANSVFARPLPLQGIVVAISEECIRIAVQHRLQEMQRAKSIFQEDTTTLFKTERFRRQYIETNQIRRLEPAILEKTHVLRSPCHHPFSVQIGPYPSDRLPVPRLRRGQT